MSLEAISYSSNPYDEWDYHFITDPQIMWDKFCQDAPKSIGSDTESTGLHIIKDKPFLIQLGWGRVVFMFEPTKPMMDMYFLIAEQVKWHFLHNLKYDLHMLTNIGYGKEVQALNNWCDSMAVMRLVVEALSPRNGGDKLGLKVLGSKYVHPYANNSEKMIDECMTKLKKARNKILATALKQFPIEGELTPTGRQKYWGSGAIEAFTKDIMNDLSDLPEGVREIWKDWEEEYPEPNYKDIYEQYRDVMLKYGGEDIATMLMLMEKAMPILISRKQLSTLERERRLLLPLYRMERAGLEVDFEYLSEAKTKLREYIRAKRYELYELAGFIIKPSQHAAIGKLFEEKWNIFLESVDKQAMKQVIDNFDGEPARFAKLINILRTAEKWYSTYIVRIEQSASFDGKAYTQINSTGALSGRMSSDFQQFPKKAIVDEDGNEIFHARRLFKVADEDYVTVYIDYDQIELVIQSHYCVMMNCEGVNLPRAYMPYKCRHYLTGEEYNFKDPEQRMRLHEKQVMAPEMSAWLTEDGTPWVKTDMHTLTASKAYPEIPVDTDDFKENYRPKGKTTNFALNYGGKEGALMKPLDIEFEEAAALVTAYEESYTEVIDYQNAIIEAHARKGFLINHYGRRYYLEDNNKAYTLANAVVQGSCADALKEAIIDIDEYMQANKLLSYMVMPIHDEQSFRVHRSEMAIIPVLLELMERAFTWSWVPATAGVEISEDYWSNKKDWEAEAA